MVYGVLTTAPNAVVSPKAMPVISTTHRSAKLVCATGKMAKASGNGPADDALKARDERRGKGRKRRSANTIAARPRWSSKLAESI